MENSFPYCTKNKPWAHHDLHQTLNFGLVTVKPLVTQALCWVQDNWELEIFPVECLQSVPVTSGQNNQKKNKKLFFMWQIGGGLQAYLSEKNLNN